VGFSAGVPDHAEFVVFWVGHHHHDALGVVVSLIQRPSAQSQDLLWSIGDVVDDHVEVDACLTSVGFGHGLEGDGGL
jgi:hypothetical protein